VYIHLCTHILIQEQRESINQRLLKMLERTFPKEQVKKREEQQEEEYHRPREGKRDHFGIASGDVDIDQDSPYTTDVTC
jgi:thiamine phosphate synthase YjbQ (UPF0047 family)